MAVLTAIFTNSLTITDFTDPSITKYDSVPAVVGVPVTLKYRVLPGNLVSFGAGSNSYGGVRTALTFQIKPMAKTGSADPVYIRCHYRLLYLDPNEVRQMVIKEGETDYVKDEPIDSNQFNYLPENTTQTASMFSFLAIQLTPLALPTAASYQFNAAQTLLSIPVTIRTLSTASGE